MTRISTIKFFLLTTLLISVFQITHAEEILSAIKGNVLTSDGQPAAFVTVQIKGTNKGALTDQKGEFLFKKIRPGRYTLLVSLIGYETVEKDVEVETDKITAVSIELTASNQQMKEIVVVGGRNKYTVENPSYSLHLLRPLVEVPQNIQVVTKEVLADQQVFDMMEGATRNISGASRMGHWDIYANIQARGSQMSSFRNGMNTKISLWSPLVEDMSVVDRIEFIKGPAGFMMAPGEPSGIYNIVTKKPTGIEQREFTLSLGSFENYRTILDLDGKLSKDGKLLYRLNMMGELRQTHRKFESNNRYTIAPVLKYQVDDRTSVTLEYLHQYVQLSAIGSNYSFSKRGYGDLPIDFTTAESNMDPTEITDKTVTVTLEHQINNDWKITAQGAYSHSLQVGQSIYPAGFTFGNDTMLQRSINKWDALGLNKTGQIFINGKVKTGAVTHSIMAGVDMKSSHYYADFGGYALFGDTFNIYHPTYGQAVAPKFDRSQDIRERGVLYQLGYNALYLQDELGFFDDKLRLTLALRYARNKYENTYEGVSDHDKFTPRLGLSYSFDKNTSAYFVYDQYFLQNPGKDWQQNYFAPLTGQNLEVGVKKDWFQGRFNSTLSLYQIRKNNVLVTDPEHLDPVTNLPASKTSGQQRIQGVEVDVKGDIVRNLGVVINYAYTDAQITEDTDPKLVGNIVPATAKHIQNTWLTYRVGSGILNGLRLSAGYQYQVGRVAGQVYDKSENALPDYFRLDGGIGYTNDKMSINVNVNNITNKYLFTGGPSAGLYYWQTEAGRNVRVTVGYKF